MLTDLVEQYGYVAVLIGSLLEGETVLLLAGMASGNGYLSFAGVVMLAFVGGTVGDQVLFQLGRRYGRAWLRRAPKLAERAARVDRLLERHRNALIVGVRFMYGLRLIGPFVIGMSKVSTARFAVLNMVGAALWAPLIVGAGYWFGESLRWLLDDLGHYEAMLLVGIVAVGVLVYWLRKRRGAAAHRALPGRPTLEWPARRDSNPRHPT